MTSRKKSQNLIIPSPCHATVTNSPTDNTLLDITFEEFFTPTPTPTFPLFCVPYQKCNTCFLTVYIMTLVINKSYISLIDYVHLSPSLTMFTYLPHWLCSLISLTDYVHLSPSLTMFTYLPHWLCSLALCTSMFVPRGKRFLEVLENDSKWNSGKKSGELSPPKNKSLR